MGESRTSDGKLFESFKLLYKFSFETSSLAKIFASEFTAGRPISQGFKSRFFEASTRVLWFIWDPSVRQGFQEFGDGSWLELFSRTELALELFRLETDLNSQTAQHPIGLYTLNRAVYDLRVFHYASKTIFLAVESSVPESTKKNYQIRLVIETGDVFLGDELRCKLEPGSPEYCWFSHLLEEPNYTTFSDAQKIYPTELESAVVTRLNDSLKDKIASNVVEVAENRVKGTRLNPIYEKV